MGANRQIAYKIVTIVLFFSQVIYSQNTNWNKDLEVYGSRLEKNHIDLFHTIDKYNFEKKIAEIKTLSEKVDDFKVVVELMKLTRQIGDGHTSVSLHNFDIHSFPFEVKKIENQWRVIKVNIKQKSLLKTSLVKIDGIPIEEVAKKVSEVAQFVENKHSETIRTGDYLGVGELLFTLNITEKKNKAVFTFLDDDNKEIKRNLEAFGRDMKLKDSNNVAIPLEVPQISKPENTTFDFLWYAPIAETQGVYIQFKGYPSFDEMQIFAANLTDYISSNQIKQIVIDMRNNRGGDLYVGVVLAYALNLADTIDWKEGVYVLTDAVTFSAAASNTALYRNLLNAKIIGQPTGSNPTGYQDMDQFELPNSKLVITYSKRKFRLSDTITQGVQPDVLVNYRWNDYAQGTDTMLEWIINHLKTIRKNN